MSDPIKLTKRYYCDACSESGAWTDEWQWYGSIKDSEDGTGVLYTCSDKCRRKIGDPETALAKKQRAASA